MWSAGMMLLSILTHKFPVFNSNDDIEALMEISAVFGRSAMEKCAALHSELVLLDELTIDRTIICNVPGIDTSPGSIQNLILKLNPHIYTPPLHQPTPVEAKAHIEAMDQAIDLCGHLLQLDVTRRPTAAMALRHRLFMGLATPAETKTGEILSGTQGTCGALHAIDSNGRRKSARESRAKDQIERCLAAKSRICTSEWVYLYPDANVRFDMVS
jgi:cell division control protein 7